LQPRHPPLHNRLKLQSRHGADEGRVKDPPGKPKAYDCNTDLCHESSFDPFHCVMGKWRQGDVAGGVDCSMVIDVKCPEKDAEAGKTF